MKPWDTRLSSPEAAISRRAEVVGRGEGVGGGREGGGRVRSVSLVQTFTSYETGGELPVLGTGCR